MLGAVGRGRGRAKLLENGPPVPLRRPRERSSVLASGGEPTPAPAVERQQLGQPAHDARDAGQWSDAAAPRLSTTPAAGLNPDSAPFVPSADGALTSAEEAAWGPEATVGEPEPVVNRALLTDIPNPENAYQSMIYNNLAEALWNMACVPASFDRQGSVLVDNLNGWLPSSGIRLSTVLDFMLNQVAYMPTFGYVCAKLCHVMCSRCRVTEDGRTFRDLLLSRCQALYRRAAGILTESVASFSELALLFAELYLHVRLAGGGEPIAVLGSAVLNLCGQLMDDVTPERVRAVCQALKLTGAALERQLAPQLDQLMERVRAAAFNGGLPRDERHALLELTTLRAAHWGGAEGGGGQPAPPSPQLETARQLQGYVLADPSSDLSTEERSFLERQLHAAEDEDEDDVDEAYDAFLEELDGGR